MVRFGIPKQARVQICVTRVRKMIRKISKSYCYGAIWVPKPTVCIFVLVDILWDPNISKPRRSAASELPQKWSANSVTDKQTYAKS